MTRKRAGKVQRFNAEYKVSPELASKIERSPTLDNFFFFLFLALKTTKVSSCQGAAATSPPRPGCNQRHTKKIPQPSPSSLPLLLFGSRLPLRHQATPQPRQRQRDQLTHGIQAALILESLQSQPRNAGFLLVSQAGIAGAAACSITGRHFLLLP